MLKDAKRIVIKIGSSLIIGEDGYPRKEWLGNLAEDILLLINENKQVIIVTSGAVALGRHVLGYGTRKLLLEEKQAAAAAGQAPLLFQWVNALQFQLDTQLSNNNDEQLDRYSRMSDWLKPAQILLTASDLKDRHSYLNARNTLETLLENPRVVPVINENDTVATAELRFGDNDRLAAQVAQMASADLLIIFSDIDGLYSADPRVNKNARFIEKITDITPEIEAMAGGAASTVSNGGMITKIVAAKIATNAGCNMIIAKGTENNPIRLLNKASAKYTFFSAKESPLSARKNWIAGSLHPAGTITIDAGAAQALQSGKSLLPAGVVKIEGDFNHGEVVLINISENQNIGRGLISYNSQDAQKIIGKKSVEIEQILGFKRRDVLIHRDDMVLE